MSVFTGSCNNNGSDSSNNNSNISSTAMVTVMVVAGGGKGVGGNRLIRVVFPEPIIGLTLLRTSSPDRTGEFLRLQTMK